MATVESAASRIVYFKWNVTECRLQWFTGPKLCGSFFLFFLGKINTRFHILKFVMPNDVTSNTKSRISERYK